MPFGFRYRVSLQTLDGTTYGLNVYSKKGWQQAVEWARAWVSQHRDVDLTNAQTQARMVDGRKPLDGDLQAPAWWRRQRPEVTVEKKPRPRQPRPAPAALRERFGLALLSVTSAPTGAKAADLKAVEQRLGVRLAKDLKDLLRWSDGGSFPGGDLMGSGELYVLDEEVFGRTDLVVFASDLGGNLWCIDADGVVYEALHDPLGYTIVGEMWEWLRQQVDYSES